MSLFPLKSYITIADYNKKMLRRCGALYAYKHMRKLEYDYLCPFTNEDVEVVSYIEHMCNGIAPLVCGERCQMWANGKASDGCVILINRGEKMGSVYDLTNDKVLPSCEICWLSKPMYVIPSNPVLPMK